jgi:5-methylcytosine-specific restriction endonuclease McrBC GTP-binding regulatory subunit McrB
MFSPKVLDRGNVIEFNRVELGEEASSLESSFKLRDSSLVLGQASIATLQDYRSAPGEFQQAIAGLQAILEPFNLHFGYRVANEMAAYVHNAIKCVGPKSTSDAIDLQILQKVLPKLHGTKQRLTTPLWRLLLFCVNGASELSAEFDEELFKSVEGQVLEGAAPETPGVPKATAAKFPRASRKIVKMLRTLRAQGFVSFVE